MGNLMTQRNLFQANHIYRFETTLTLIGQYALYTFGKGYLANLHRLAIAQNHYVFSKIDLSKVVLESWDRELSNGAKIFVLNAFLEPQSPFEVNSFDKKFAKKIADFKKERGF